MSPRILLRGALVAVLLLTAACGEGTATSQNTQGTPVPYDYRTPNWVDDASGSAWEGDDIQVPSVSCQVPAGLPVLAAPIPCRDEVIAHFHFAGGLKFSDGQPVDSVGSAYSIDQPLDTCTKSPCPEGGQVLIYSHTKMTDSDLKKLLNVRDVAFSMAVIDLDKLDGSQSGKNQIYLDVCPQLSPIYTGPDWAQYCGTVVEPLIFENFTCDDSEGACDEVTQSAGGPVTHVDRRTMLPRMRRSDLHPASEVNIRLLRSVLGRETSPAEHRISHGGTVA